MLLLSRVGRSLGHLKRPEDAPADRQGVGNRLHAGRPFGELVVPEIRLAQAGRHDEVIVGQLDRLAERPEADEPPPRGVNVDGLSAHALQVVLLAEQPPQRCGDLSLGQNAGRALIQQRLEDVLRGAVD